MDGAFKGMVDELRRRTRLQPTPIEYTISDYSHMIIHGLKEYYIDFGNSDRYALEFNYDTLSFNTPLNISCEEYVMVCAMIDFYSVVLQDVNTIVGYSTDSLTLTNADKPYANLSNEIDKLEDRRVDLFFKIRAESEE